MHIKLSCPEYNYIGVWHFLQNELNENTYWQMQLLQHSIEIISIGNNIFQLNVTFMLEKNPKYINRFCDWMASIVLTSFPPVELLRSNCNAIYRKQNKI